jgi:hypothetical protein
MSRSGTFDSRFFKDTLGDFEVLDALPCSALVAGYTAVDTISTLRSICRCGRVGSGVVGRVRRHDGDGIEVVEITLNRERVMGRE